MTGKRETWTGKQVMLLMGLLFGIPLAIAGLVAIWLRTRGPSYEPASDDDLQRFECQRDWRRHYRALETYPTLPDGRDADAVIGERCAKDPTDVPKYP